MKRYLVILLLVLSTSSVTGQRIYFHTTGYMGFKNTLETEYFYDGGGIEFGYAQELSKGRLVTGLNYRLIYWSHQVGLSAAYDYPLWEDGSWRASVQAGAGVDLALFVQRSLWGWNINALPRIEWQSEKVLFRIFWTGGSVQQQSRLSGIRCYPFDLGCSDSIGYGFSTSTKGTLMKQG